MQLAEEEQEREEGKEGQELADIEVRAGDPEGLRLALSGALVGGVV